MRDGPADGESEGVATNRRTVLRGLGAVAGTAALGAPAAAATGDGPGYVLVQADTCVPMVPLSGDEPVEDLYDYRLPERYASTENGATDPGTGPYYSSAGTASLQAADSSVLFLYDGPDGLSLVVVHGDVAEGGGGSATFTLSNVPAGASWVVKDDLYRDPETGEIEDTNYDRWETDGDAHEIDWTWGERTDGGVLRGLGDDFELEIDPAFNEDAALYAKHYEGDVEDWQAVVGSRDGLDRVGLDLDEPVTLRSGECDGEPLFEVGVGDVSLRVYDDEIQIRVFGAWVSISGDGIDVDLRNGG